MPTERGDLSAALTGDSRARDWVLKARAFLAGRLAGWTIFAVVVAMDWHRIASVLPRSIGGDEWRYVYYAGNLLHGFFSPQERVALWNGPGYPALLMPFVKADWLDGGRYLNAFLHAGTVAYSWWILRLVLEWPWALACVAVLSFYGPLNEHLPLLYTEVATVFFLTAWAYHFLRGLEHGRHLVVAAFYLGSLCMVKVAFGSALAASLVIMLIVWWRGRGRTARAYLKQGALAMILCVPYLVYTYGLTGRAFYWSSSMADNFYWLSTPDPQEWGDWYHPGWVYQNPILRAQHKSIVDRTTGLDQNPNLPWMDQIFNTGTPRAGAIYMAEGMRNIREHPFKYARNWCGNLVRLFLDVPVSVRGTPFWNDYSRWNLPFLAWAAFVAAVALLRRTWLPPDWSPILLLMGVLIGEYSFIAVGARFSVPIVPMGWLAGCLLLARAFHLGIEEVAAR
jgi:hypothetical protein